MLWYYRRLRRTLIFVILFFLVFWATGYVRDIAFSRAPSTPAPRHKSPSAPNVIEKPRPLFQVDDLSVKEAKREGKKFAGRPAAGRAPELRVTSQTPLPSHEYRPDGLLEVNPDGAHPIYELTKRAEVMWNKKLKTASKTLDQAVAEYERRYRRKPPLGFDAWWFYVEQNKVQLPDEYDQIYRDLEPFWGMDPADLQRLEYEWEGHGDTYTIGKVDGSPIDIVNFTLPEGIDVQERLLQGGYEFIELLEEVQEFIPPFRAIFSPHDNPNLPLDYELKSMALEAAAAHTYINVNKPPRVKEGWVAGCPPKSPARRTKIDLDAPVLPQSGKTFIYDHRRAMDPCKHPSHFHHHGQFLSHNYGPVPHRMMIPQFSYCSTMLHHDIVPPTPINWVDDVAPEDNPPWEARSDERLLWRGTNTGIWHDLHTRWRGAHRIRLVSHANDLSGNASFLRSPETDAEQVGEAVVRRKALVNPALMDVSFAGDGPNSCREETCGKLREMFEFRGHQTLKKAGNYKYVMDVDGNGWSSRFKRLITSNALIFKSTVYPEWYTDRIAPWVHYVPVQLDLSDLHDSLVFFRGDLNGEGGHDELARQIATAGRDWSKRFWRKEDLTAYMFRLFLEYARVMSLDREALSYTDWEHDEYW